MILWGYNFFLLSFKKFTRFFVKLFFITLTKKFVNLGNIFELKVSGKKVLELFPYDHEILYVVGNALGKAGDLQV